MDPKELAQMIYGDGPQAAFFAPQPQPQTPLDSGGLQFQGGVPAFTQEQVAAVPVDPATGTPVQTGPAAPAPLAPGQKAGDKVKVKTSSASSGYSEDKARQIKSGVLGDKATDAQIKTAQNSAKEDFASSRKNFVNIERGAAEISAALGEDYANIERLKGISAGQEQTALLDHATELKQIYADGQAQAAQAMADYRDQLMRIPEVNPGALWDDAGTSGQFAMGIAAFVHDFLGAKGIRTSAMDTINNAIKNKMEAQIQNMRRGEKVADGFKQLYEMAQASSSSKAEAAAKMHGYYLKSIEAGLQAELGSLNANVAKNKQAAALIATQTELAKQLAEVDQHIAATADARVRGVIELRGQNIQASIASQRNATDIAVEKIRAGAAADARAAKDKGGPPLIHDVSESGQGQPIAQFKPEWSDNKQLMVDVSDKVNKTSELIRDTRQLVQLQEQIDRDTKLGGSSFEALGRLRNKKERLESAIRTRIKALMLLDTTGKAANKVEFENADKILPQHDFLTNGENKAIFGRYIRSAIQNARDSITQYANSGSAKFAEAEFIEASKWEADEKPTVTSADKRVFSVASPDSMKPMKEPDETDGPEAQQQYYGVTKPMWEEFSNSNPKVKSKSGSFLGSMADTARGASVPEAFNDLRELARLAYENQPGAAEKLYVMSTAKGSDKKEIRAMAEYFLNKLKTASSNDAFGIQ